MLRKVSEMANFYFWHKDCYIWHMRYLIILIVLVVSVAGCKKPFTPSKMPTYTFAQVWDSLCIEYEKGYCYKNDPATKDTIIFHANNTITEIYKSISDTIIFTFPISRSVPDSTRLLMRIEKVSDTLPVIGLHRVLLHGGVTLMGRPPVDFYYKKRFSIISDSGGVDILNL